MVLRFFLLLTAFSLPGLAAVENWPQYRGPLGDGHAEVSGLPLQFSEEQHVKWKAPLPGKAWSSPVIWGEQIWVTDANEEGTELSVFCLEKETGKIVQQQLLFKVATPQEAHRFNSYASPTPVIEEGRIYVTFGSPGTACLDTKTGQVLWQRTDLKCNHFRGAGSSPILWQNLLIMNFDGSDFDYVIALDKETGKTVWKTDRSVDYQDLEPDGKPKAEGDFRKAFATPHVAEVNGQPVLFSSGAKAHYAYEPRTGREYWRVEERAQHSCATRPIVGNGMLYISTGFGKAQLLAIKLPEMREPPATPVALPESEIAWRIPKSIPSKPSLLLRKEHLYMVDDGGIASCVNAQTGEIVWRERIQGNFSSSPICTDDGRIYIGSEEGKVYVFAAEPQFKVLAENKLPDGIMAAPAVSGHALYYRTKTALYRLDE